MATNNQTNNLNLKAMLVKQQETRSVCPPAITKSPVPTEQPKIQDANKKEVIEKQTVYRALRIRHIILENGSKVYPNALGFFDETNPYIKKTLQYFYSLNRGLVEKL